MSLLTPVRAPGVPGAPAPRAGVGGQRPGRVRRAPLPNRPVVLALIAVVALLPVLRPTGPMNSSPVDIFVALALGLGVLAWGQNAMPVRGPYGIPIALLLLGGCLGSLVGPDPSAGFQAIVQDLPLFALCAVATSAMASRRAFRAVIAAWARASLVWASLLAVGVFGHISALSGVRAQYGARASLTMGDPNAAADFLVVSFFLVLASGVPRPRPLRVLGLALLLLDVVLTGSNGAVTAILCGSAVAIVAALAVRHGLHPGGAVVVLAAGLAVLVAALPLSTYLADIGSQARQSSTPIIRDSIGRVGQSAGTRSELLSEAVTLYLEGHPFGAGPGSTKARLEATQAPYAKEAHSDYSASLIERGPFGAAGVLLLLMSAWANVWHVLRRPRQGAPGTRPAARAAPLLGAVTAVFVSGAFYEVLHFRQVWLLLAIVAAFRRLDEHSPKAVTDATR